MRREYSGEIDLSFAKKGDRTLSDKTYRSGNSRISANIPVAGDIPCYFLISTGGGFVEGERYRQSIHLGRDAHAIVATQTPSYIYKCEHGLTTSQSCRVCLEEGSCLEFYMDETIPYKDAIYEQKTEVDMEAGCRLLFTGGLTGGWSPDGSLYTYGRIGQHLKIRREGKLLYNDYLRMDPRRERVQELGLFEGAGYFHSAVVIDPEIDAAAVDLMRQYLSKVETHARYGVSLLEEDGAALRILGPDADENRAVLDAFIRCYREEIRGMAPVSLRKRNGAGTQRGSQP